MWCLKRDERERGRWRGKGGRTVRGARTDSLTWPSVRCAAVPGRIAPQLPAAAAAVMLAVAASSSTVALSRRGAVSERASRLSPLPVAAAAAAAAALAPTAARAASAPSSGSGSISDVC